MNKTYRSVWNEALGAWVATSELGGGRRKGAQRAAVGVALVLLAMGAAQAQVKIGDNPTINNPASLLELESTDRGLLMPRIALPDRATWALNGNQPPVEGMMVYNTNATTGTNGLQAGMAVWKGGQWVSVDETPYLHVNSTATGNSTLANSGATGADSVAIGPSAVASGADSVAVGSGAQANQASAIALGRNASVTSGSSNAQSGGIAIGLGAQVAHNNITLPDGTVVTPGGNTASMAIGVNAQAHYNKETIVGAGAGQNASRFIAAGETAASIQTYGSDSVMVGTDAGQGSQYLYATFVGDEAGRGSVGQHNSYVGQNAARWRDGSNNTALGSNAFVGTSSSSHLTGSSNTALGSAAGAYSSGDNNTWTGYFAGGNTKGNRNVATGSGAGGGVTGDDNVASGTTAGVLVIGSDNVAVGNLAGLGVAANRTISMGRNARASKDDAIAIGSNSTASGVSSISVGTGNNVSGARSGTFGDPTTITGSGSYSVGNDNTINANNAFVLGNNVTIASGLDGAVGIGNNSTVTASTVASYNPGTGTVAGTATGSNVVSVGASGAERRVTNVAAGGADTDAVNVSQLKAVKAAVNAIDFPVRSSVAGPYTTSATGANAFAAGATARASGNATTAVGEGAIAVSTDLNGGATAFGRNALAAGSGVTALGSFAGFDSKNADSSTYVGSSAGQSRDGTANTAVGASALQGGTGSANTVLGVSAGNSLKGDNNVLVGGGAGTGNVGSENVVIGSVAGFNMHASRAVVLGSNATSAVDDGVALGSRSVTRRAGGSAGYVPSSANAAQMAAINATTSTVGAVSVGDAGNGVYRQITGVAAGTADSDAVNVSQLRALDATVAANKTKYYSVNSTGGGNENNDGATGADAIASGKNAVASGNNSYAAGLGATATSANSVAIGPNAVASNGGLVALGDSAKSLAQNTIAIGTNANASVRLGIAIGGASVSAGNGAVAIGDATNSSNFSTVALGQSAVATGSMAIGLGRQANASGSRSMALGALSSSTVAGGVALGSGSVSDRAIAGTQGDISVALTPEGDRIAVPYNTTDRTLLGAVSVGSATSYRQIINVADGTQASDAVTVRQLTGALSSFATTPTKYFHANSTAADSAAVGTDSVAIGPQTIVNGNNGIGMGNGATVQASAPGGIAIGQASTSGAADAVALGTQATANATQGVALGAGSNVTQAGGVALGAGSVASTASGVAGYIPPTATAAQRTAIGATTSTLAAVSVGDASTGQYRQITGVAAGTVDSDAVNVSQLKAVQGQVAQIDQGTVKYDTHTDGSVDYNSVTMGGSNTTGAVTVHNVAPGVAGTDAVNVDQLNAGLEGAKQYTDQRFNQLSGDVRKVAKQASAGTASAIAMANLPQAYIPGKSMVSVGVGGFDGEAGLALGVSKLSDNARWVVKFSATGNTRGKFGVGAGAGFHW